MLIIMILNLVIFTGLFTGLNTMGAYKVASQYESLKYTYVNCLEVTDEYLTNGGEKLDGKFKRIMYFTKRQRNKNKQALNQMKGGTEND